MIYYLTFSLLGIRIHHYYNISFFYSKTVKSTAKKSYKTSTHTSYWQIFFSSSHTIVVVSFIFDAFTLSFLCPKSQLGDSIPTLKF